MTAFSDGKAVNIIAPADLDKGDFVRADGLNGIALETKNSGEDLAMEVDTNRMHYVTLPAAITGKVKGEVIYVIVATGVLTATSSGNMPALLIVEDEDTNRVAGVRVLNSGIVGV